MSFSTQNTLTDTPDLLAPEKVRQGQVRILLIADKAAQTRFRCLYDRHHVIVAATASEGLQLLLENPCDCVFLYLPAIETLQFLVQRRQHTVAVPVVVVTPPEAMHTASEALDKGATGYLPESQLTPEGLHLSLNNALRLHQAESRCRQAEARYNALQYQLEFVIANAPINAWSCDKTGALTYLKGDGLLQLGVDAGKAIGKHYSDLYQEYPQVIARFEKAMAGEQVQVITETNGRYFKACYVPVRDQEGAITGITGVAYDITDQVISEQEMTKAKELAEESLRVKEQFIANITHELRTPLNGIIGLSGLLQKTALSPEQQRYLHAIQRSSGSLTYLINDLLDMAKITAHKITFEQIPFNLYELVQEVLDLMEPEARLHQNVISYAVSPDMPLQLAGDSLRLRQILLNLIGNAVKFTHKGLVKLSVQVLARTGAEATLAFQVQDTGIGIPAENLQAIFESFNQGHNDVARKYGGTGLGLAITKSLVELQGGQLQVKSKTGEGSTFTFSLPFKIHTPMDHDDKVTNQKALPQEQPFGQMRILLAEDNEINQLLVNTVLEEWGCVTDTVTNGKEALAKLKQNKYDLILMDMQMPVMDGYEAIIKIRQSGAHYAKIPIIALTAHATTAEVEECLATGADGYLSKPFEPEELHENIVRLTAEYRAHSK